MQSRTKPIIWSGVGMRMQVIAGGTTNKQLERHLEPPLVEFEEGRGCHVDQVLVFRSYERGTFLGSSKGSSLRRKQAKKSLNQLLGFGASHRVTRHGTLKRQGVS
jgi:hypothetical protein